MVNLLEIDDSPEAVVLWEERITDNKDPKEELDSEYDEEEAKRYLTDEHPTESTRYGRNSLTY
jgi:hypothetical protein